MFAFVTLGSVSSVQCHGLSWEERVPSPEWPTLCRVGRKTLTRCTREINLYHSCVKKFFGFQRRDSMSQVLIELSLPSADTVIYNSRVLYHV